MNLPKSYFGQLGEMAFILSEWRSAKKPALIQFNYPPSVAIIATISDAIRNHFVTADAGGMELLTALGMGSANEPTVLMIKAVIDLEYER